MKRISIITVLLNFFIDQKLGKELKISYLRALLYKLISDFCSALMKLPQDCH
jgi:hypothetical protein